MAESHEHEHARLRLLALGNDILSDDAFGLLVAGRVAGRAPGRLEVVTSSASGFHLLDHVLGVGRLLVVDVVQTGRAPAGTLYIIREEDVEVVHGGSPHYTGLFEMLAVARELRLATPAEVLILAVEAADCLTVGGAMHPAVEAAVERVTDLIVAAIGQPDPFAALAECVPC